MIGLASMVRAQISTDSTLFPLVFDSYTHVHSHIDDVILSAALRERLQGLIDKEKANGETARDVGNEINQLLTENFQRASRRATQKRRASKKIRKSGGAG